MKCLTLTILAVALSLTAGCQKMNELQLNEGLAPGRGTSRILADVSYPQALAAAREVMSQYYSIDPARTSASTGIIACRPKRVDAGNDRLLGGFPARQLATMQLTSENGSVIAQVLVLQQRQGASVNQDMGYSVERTNYSGAPGNESPASLDAATTTEQNENWTTEKTLHSVETQILNDLAARLGNK